MPSRTGEVVTAANGKKLLDCTFAEVEDMVRAVIALLGLRDAQLPKGQVKEFMVTEVKQELSNYTREEVRLALSLAMKKAIDFDTRLYDSMISVDWFARLMSAYKSYRNERLIAERNKPKPEQKQLVQPEGEAYRKGIVELWRKVKAGTDTDTDWWLVRSLNESRYLYLEGIGAINIDPADKWDTFERAKVLYREELERDLGVATARLDRPSVEMVKEAISQFELDNTDTTNGGRLRQTARILSLKEWMYELRDTNQELPKLTK